MTASEKATVLDVITVLLTTVGGLALTAWFTQVLWDWLMPALFHLPQIGFWQALGLRMLVQNVITPLGAKKKD